MTVAVAFCSEACYNKLSVKLYCGNLNLEQTQMLLLIIILRKRVVFESWPDHWVKSIIDINRYYQELKVNSALPLGFHEINVT